MLTTSGSTSARIRLAPALGAALLTVALAGCGDMVPPKDATTALPSASSDSATADPMPTTGNDVSAVIGGWAARYGSARNEVTAALDALGASAGGGTAAVKKAAAEALTVTAEAGDVPECPDPATGTAYRAALDDVTASLSELEESGDVTKAQQVAEQAQNVFTPTDEALRAAYN